MSLCWDVTSSIMVFLFGFAFCILPGSFARLPCHFFHLVHTWATVSRLSFCSDIRRCRQKTGDRRISRKRRNVLVKKVCNAVQTSARTTSQIHNRCTTAKGKKAHNYQVYDGPFTRFRPKVTSPDNGIACMRNNAFFRLGIRIEMLWVSSTWGS